MKGTEGDGLGLTRALYGMSKGTGKTTLSTSEYGKSPSERESGILPARHLRGEFRAMAQMRRAEEMQ